MYNKLEVWKKIKGAEFDYLVSNKGRVKSIKFGKEKIITPSKVGAGYLALNICVEGKIKRKYIHRLVAEAFIPNPEKKPQVNHIDEVKTNNEVSNLEWLTSKENINHGTLSKRKSTKVFQLTKENVLVKKWDSIKEATKQGFTNSGIVRCCNNKIKSHKGFVWKYKI